MSTSKFAKTPEPPYYAAILSAQRTEGDNGYAATAQRLVELVGKHPGFLGAESITDPEGFNITVAYFDSEDAIRSWKHDLEHEVARKEGRERWYSHYAVRVAKVERAYDSSSSED